MQVSNHIKKVCKIGQGSACCKYLTLGSKGFECAKIKPSLKKQIDKKWLNETHVAQGDNCEGKENTN